MIEFPSGGHKGESTTNTKHFTNIQYISTGTRKVVDEKTGGEKFGSNVSL